MAEASELALALADHASISLADLQPQDSIANLPPQSPIVAASPPRTKQRVSEISCFTSDADGAPIASGDFVASITTSAESSCFVSLLCWFLRCLKDMLFLLALPLLPYLLFLSYLGLPALPLILTSFLR